MTYRPPRSIPPLAPPMFLAMPWFPLGSLHAGFNSSIAKGRNRLPRQMQQYRHGLTSSKSAVRAIGVSNRSARTIESCRAKEIFFVSPMNDQIWTYRSACWRVYRPNPTGEGPSRPLAQSGAACPGRSAWYRCLPSLRAWPRPRSRGATATGRGWPSSAVWSSPTERR